MSRGEAKRKALDVLKGNWGYAVLIMFLYTLIIGALSGASFGIGGWLLSVPLTIGLYIAFINGSINGSYKIEDLFAGFQDGLVNRIILSLLKNLFIILWSLLFIIPGIVKSYAYLLAEYISIQHPDYTYDQCLDKSQELMQGHKWEMFVLDLSFLGWMILCCFTFGIGNLFLNPYMQATKIEYIDANIMAIKSYDLSR